MVEAKREIIVKLRDQQRQAVHDFYANTTGRESLRRALQLPGTPVRMKLTNSELDQLLALIEEDYEATVGEGRYLRRGLFKIRNTLALCQMYGIVGDEL